MEICHDFCLFVCLKVSEAEKELDKAEKELQSTASRSVAQGLFSMKKVVEDNEMEGVHGPLIELFRPKKEALRTAIDVTAGIVKDPFINED